MHQGSKPATAAAGDFIETNHVDLLHRYMQEFNCQGLLLEPRSHCVTELSHGHRQRKKIINVKNEDAACPRTLNPACEWHALR